MVVQKPAMVRSVLSSRKNFAGLRWASRRVPKDSRVCMAKFFAAATPTGKIGCCGNVC